MYKCIMKFILVLSVFAGTISADLIGHWKFDDEPGSLVAIDSAGESDGIVASFAEGSLPSAEFTGPGEGFDGVGGALNYEVLVYGGYYGRVTVPAQALATLERQITVAWWQKGADVNPRRNYILGAAVSHATDPWIFFTQCPDTLSGTQFIWQAGGSMTPDLMSGLLDDSVPGAGNENWYKNQWNHYACTKNVDTGMMRIYHNGQLWFEIADATVPMRGSEAYLFTIGDHPYTGASYVGLLDDVRVYDHELSQEEIQALLCIAEITGDINDDCVVNFLDYAVLAGDWLAQGGGPYEADLDSDGNVNSADLGILVNDWLSNGFWVE
jgi:hypothetical protein